MYVAVIQFCGFENDSIKLHSPLPRGALRRISASCPKGEIFGPDKNSIIASVIQGGIL